MINSKVTSELYLDPGIQLIRDKIRFGKNPNNPELIPLWLTQESVIQDSVDCLILRRQNYEDQFRLMLETVVDELVPRHWRQLCLEYIYQPLSSLRKISCGEQTENRLRQLLAELSSSCRYVAATL